MNAITYRVALEIASHEAIIRQAYKDSVGVWTWSIGLTNATGHNVDRYIGKPQPMEHCLRIYAWALEKYAQAVRKAFAGHALTEAQFAAALSFHYNTGSIAKASWVTLWKQGDVAGARKAFMSWSKPAEIIPRRQKERDLFFDGKWSSDGRITEYTRVKTNGTPDWGSGVRVNVEADLRRALGQGSTPAAPEAPATPKPSPAPTTPAKTSGDSPMPVVILIGIAFVLSAVFFIALR